MIDVPSAYLQIVLDILKTHAPDCEVRVFGSRFKWTAKDYSDLDLALVGPGRLHWKTLARLRAALEESSLPFRVDVLDWHAISPEFQQVIAQGYEVVQDPKGLKRPLGSAGWDIVRIDSICRKVTSGGTPSTRTPEYYGGSIPWLKTQEINFNRIYDTETKITEAGLNNSSAKWIPVNSVIVAMYGATAGKVAINKILLTTNQACCNLIINDEFADYNYVYYNLLARFSEIASMAVGGAQQNLNAQMIRGLEMPLPPLPTQRRIAAILSALDDKIELNRQTNATLEAIAQAIFKEWFVDFNFPGATGEMIESALGMIPQGWRIRSLYDSATYINGAAYRNIAFSLDRSGLPVIKINELKYGITSQTDFTNEELEPKYKINDGEILFSWSGSPDTSLDTFVWSGGPAWLNQHIFRVIPHGASETHFIHYLLRHLKPILIEIARDKQTTGLGHVTAQDMKRMQVVYPPDSVMQAFGTLIAPVYDQKLNNALELHTLAALRDALLPKLMSGEISV